VHTKEMTGAMTNTMYVKRTNQQIKSNEGIEYAYRDTGTAGVPLVFLQHFRGNLDDWDPALIDSLSFSRRVITFDNVGVGGSSGVSPNTIQGMARGVLSFLDAMGLAEVDILGFSIGSFVAQELALVRPGVVRKLVLASAAPRGAAGAHGWAPAVIGAVGKPSPGAEDYLSVFFSGSASSMSAGGEVLGRIYSRQTDRDDPVTPETRRAQYDAVCEWGIPNHAMLQRLSAIDAPVFIANGDSDPMIPPHYSHLLAGLIPHAHIKIYKDSAHGFLFQHHEEFSADVASFLGE
jgi:pimeloyl-ACP methyl ester carboxylesterase